MRLTRREFLAAGAALTLAACGGGSEQPVTDEAVTEPETAEQEEPQQEEAVQEEEQAEPVEKDFDGTGMTETGDCTFYLATPGGTSENGNVPQVVADGYDSMQIGYEIWDGDGTVCTIYVDGMENKKDNAGNVQSSIDLSGDALAEGVHTVELVAMEGDEVKIYKSGQYEIVY